MRSQVRVLLLPQLYLNRCLDDVPAKRFSGCGVKRTEKGYLIVGRSAPGDCAGSSLNGGVYMLNGCFGKPMVVTYSYSWMHFFRMYTTVMISFNVNHPNSPIIATEEEIIEKVTNITGHRDVQIIDYSSIWTSSALMLYWFSICSFISFIYVWWDLAGVIP